MGTLNKVFLIGRLGQDPEKRITPAGHSVINISLATSEFYKDQAGNRQEKTEWHRIVLWNRLAELVERYCRKGSQIFVEGSLQTREWQDKDSNRRYTTEIVVRNLQLLDSRPQSDSGGGGHQNYSQSQGGYSQPQGDYQSSDGATNPPMQNQGGAQPMDTAGKEENDFVEDDIPF